MSFDWDFERLYSLLFTQSKVGVVIREITSGQIYDINQTYLDLIGRTREEMSQLTFKDISHPDEQAVHEQLSQRMLRNEISQYTIAKRYLKKSGEVVWAQVTCSAIPNGQPSPTQIIAIAQDITESKLVDEALDFCSRLERSQPHAQLFNALCSKIQSLLNLSAVFILRANRQGVEVIGTSHADVVDNGTPVNLDQLNVLDDKHGEFIYLSQPDATRMLLGQQPLNTWFQYQRILLKPLVQDENRSTGIIVGLMHAPSSKQAIIESVMNVAAPVISREIGLLDDANTRWFQANYDHTTGLPNRLYFADTLKQLTQDKGNGFALLFIDIDDFKSINDTFGHHFGDRVLGEAGKLIQTCLRNVDMLFRIGGDEFIVIAPRLSDGFDASHIANRILALLGSSVQIDAKLINLKCSIGITQFPEDLDKYADLLTNADQAMYTAKRLGKHRYVYFSDAIKAKSRRYSLIQQDLRDALQKNQLFLVFQPIINLHKDETAMIETLLRWEHPELGIVSPLEFIPIAEEIGEISAITLWIFNQVCSLIKQLHQQHGYLVKFAINISPLQFKPEHVSFFDVVQIAVSDPDLPKSSLVFEITENVLIADEGVTRDIMKMLRLSGIEISLDDFGVGYSSISYLKSFDFDSIKLDKSLVSSIANHHKERMVFNAIVDLAQKIGMKVVAEGIEDDHVLSLVKQAHVEYGQGYYYAKPLTLNALISYLNQETVKASNVYTLIQSKS